MTFNLSHYRKSKSIQNGLIAFSFKCLGVIASFGFNYIIAKHYGASITGVYFLAINIITVAYTISTYGYQNTILKVVSTNFSLKNNQAIAKAIKYALLISLTLSAAVILILLFWGNFFENRVFHEKGLGERLKILALSIAFTTVAQIGSEYLRGINKFAKSLFVKDFATPILSCGILFLFIQLKSISELNIYYATLISSAVVCFFTLLFIYRSLIGFKNQESNEVSFSFSSTNGMSWNFFVISMMGTLAKWADVFFIGIFCKASEVGIYGISKRSAYLISFFLYAVNTVVTPKFAQFKANGEMDKLKSLYKKSIMFLSVLLVPPLIFVIIFSKSILGLFGNEFVAGSTIFILIVLGQVFNVITGPCNFLLSMVGYDKLLRNATLMFTLGAVAGSFFAVKYYGIMGAAVVNFLFIMLSNLYSFIIIVRRIFLKNEYALK